MIWPFLLFLICVNYHFASVADLCKLTLFLRLICVNSNSDFIFVFELCDLSDVVSLSV